MLKSRLRNLNFFNISIQLYFNTVYEPFPQHLHFNSEKTSYIILTYFLLSSTGVGFDKKYIRTWVELGKNMVCSYQGLIVDLFRPFCAQIMLKFNIYLTPKNQPSAPYIFHRHVFPKNNLNNPLSSSRPRELSIPL